MNKRDERAGLRLLHDEILADFKDQLPGLRTPQLFIAWFLEAKFDIDLKDAERAITDGPGDKGVDAVYVDSEHRKIYLVQSKYSKQPRGSQKRDELILAASIARILCSDDDEEFGAFIRTARPDVAIALRTAYERLWERGYTLEVLFVTCKNVSRNLIDDMRREFRSIRDASLSIIGINQVLDLAEQYFDGEAPAIDKIFFKIVNQQSIFYHSDKQGSLSSYVCETKCSEFVNGIERSGHKLQLFFHRNIRGFLGESQAVNTDILDTLKNEPNLFFYLNNGITVLTTGVKKSGTKLTLIRPQIINGQQTTNVLFRNAKLLKPSATVVVRLIILGNAGNYQLTRDLIGKLVKASNWQSTISKADLMSNDPAQIKLQRHMARRHCLYLRKRGSAAQFRPPGKRFRATIRKERLAQAVGACMFDQRVIRSGVDHLFDEAIYPKIFSVNRKVDWYLARYFTERAIDKARKHHTKKTVWTYAKWMVVGHVWSLISSAVSPGGKTTARTRAFVDAMSYDRGNPEIKKSMQQISIHTFRMAAKFYKIENNGKDESLFFRDRKDLKKSFSQFTKKKALKFHRNIINRELKKLDEELASAIES